MSTIQMTEEQVEMARVFDTPPDKREGKTLFTVRFNPKTQMLFKGPTEDELAGRTRVYRRRFRKGEATVVRYRVEPARTPSEGRYMRRVLTVRTQDGRRWVGQLKTGTDVVKLRLWRESEE